MRSLRATPRVYVVVLGVLLLGGVILGSGVGVAQFAQVADSEQAHTTLAVTIAPGGDAQWEITLRFALDSEDSAAFERLADEFETGESGVLPLTPFAEAASLASDETGRSMEIRNVSRSSSQVNSTGYLVLAFEWSEFARVSGDQMVLGDVFQTGSGGTWLPQLGADQELIIEFPSTFAVRSSSRALTNGSFYVEGPAEFEAGQPFAELERTGGGGTNTPDESGLFPLVLGVVGVLLGVVLVLMLLVQRDVVSLSREDSDGGSVVVESVEDVADDVVGDEDEEAEEPLLSDEERVIQLLEGNGGRMKQVDIVKETDWSNAKVSQLLTEMESKDVIDKLRIGRENLISLPGESVGESE